MAVRLAAQPEQAKASVLPWRQRQAAEKGKDPMAESTMASVAVAARDSMYTILEVGVLYRE